MNIEIEAKYIVPDRERFERLLALTALGAYRLQPAGEQDLVDHYFDTAVRGLLQGGYAMRLREDQRRQRWRGTLKGLGRAGDALHRRQEFELDVPPGALPAAWPSSPARDLALRLSGELPLAEMFTVRQMRHKRQVWSTAESANGEADAAAGARLVAELSLDEVLLAQAEGEQPNFELELELLAGGLPEDLGTLQTALAGLGLAPQPRSKFERGLALLDAATAGAASEGDRSAKAPAGAETAAQPAGDEGTKAATVSAAPKRAKSPGVRADEPMAEAGRQVLRFHFERMLAQEAGARLGDDIEAVHTMRVATRRQRAALALFAGYFKPKAIRPFRRGLRAMAACLGAVRDLDVLLEAARGYQAGLPPASAAGLEAVLAAWDVQREAARGALLVHLDGGAFRDFVDDFGRFLNKEGAGVARPSADPAAPTLVRDVLPARLWQHYGAVRAYAPLLPGADVPTLHALRIAGKRLRYALEFFAEALGPAIQADIAAVVALQDHLGALHDADVTINRLHDFLEAGDPRPSPEAVLAVGGYLRVQQARLRRLQRTAGRPWKKVVGRRFRAVLGRAVAEL
ncbi:MAG: CHAD domain-containing protein [Anaerolineales bacterium]|nr:CHAD domain-containing protein [Anaerolineales bacterium]